MSIQRAEELKREWTDRFVKVQSGIPELRRFEGLVGTVRTVNMNCRLLIEFDTPADISWYDIDPQFVLAVDADEANKISQASKTKASHDDKATAKAAPATKPAPTGKPTGGSPLDAIRAGGGGGGAAAAKPAAGGNPLDAIRAGGGAAVAKPAAGGSPLDAIRAGGGGGGAAVAKPAAGGSPLDAIRAGGTAAGSKSATGTSPLDAIRANFAGAAGASSANVGVVAPETAADATSEAMAKLTQNPQVAKTSTGGSPLDQIRAQSGPVETAASTATSVDTNSAADSNSAPGDNGTSDKGSAIAAQDAASTGAIVASAAAAPGTGGGAAAAATAIGASTSATSIDSSETDALTATSEVPDAAGVNSGDVTSGDVTASDVDSAQTASSSTVVPGDSVAVDSRSSNLLSSPATVVSNTSDLSALEQIRSQASADDAVSSSSGTQQTLFDQVKQQAAEDCSQPDAAATSTATDGSATASTAAAETGSEPCPVEVGGVEDPVKQTFKGKKLPRLDDLKIIEGIGPKIEELFNADGINTWKQLSEADTDRLKQLLEEAGPRFRMHNPETWPRQAALADQGKWQELEEYQEHLDGGRPPE